MTRLIAGIEPSPLDHRDYPYISPFTPEQIKPVIDLRHDVFEIEDQGAIGSCVANGVCSQCEVIGEPGIKLEYVNRFRMHARIVPKPHEIGQRVKIWVGGIIHGQAFMKKPTSDRSLFVGNVTRMDSAEDQWIPAEQSGFLPVIDDYEIREDNPIRVISWRDLRPLAGGDIYVAYGDGDNVYAATLEKICTIPSL